MSSQSYEAAEGIASLGSQMSRSPSPSPSTPCPAQVLGMNCAMPRASAEETARGFQPLSW